jgi:hypothetical protein
MHETIEIPGKYRSIVTKLSHLILDQIKLYEHKQSSYKVIYFKEIINKDIPLHFYLGLQIMHSTKLYVTGDTYNPTESISTQIPYIEISIQTNQDKIQLSEISLKLSNTIRHEIEHITQSGLNTLPGKYLPDDQLLRENANEKEYLLLKKEIPATIRGIYSEAQKSKKPFDIVLRDYLNSTYLLERDIEEIVSIYLDKAKELNLWKK